MSELDKALDKAKDIERKHLEAVECSRELQRSIAARIVAERYGKKMSVLDFQLRMRKVLA